LQRKKKKEDIKERDAENTEEPEGGVPLLKAGAAVSIWRGELIRIYSGPRR